MTWKIIFIRMEKAFLRMIYVKKEGGGKAQNEKIDIFDYLKNKK